MMVLQKIASNAVAVVLVTIGLVELINVDAVARAINALSETAAWIEFRTLLGVYGPESEENLMFASYVAVSLALSVAIVVFGRRLVLTKLAGTRKRKEMIPADH